MSVTPGVYNFTIYQGATFERMFTWEAPLVYEDEVTMVPVDLTGYTARLQIRARVGSVGEPLFEATTEDGRIVLGDEEGTILLIFDAEDTAAMAFKHGSYDLELDSGGTVTRLLMGKVTLSHEVTR